MLFALPRFAVFISAVLFNGVVVWASAHTDLVPGFLQCQECFFKGTPPQSLSELGLEQRCHRHLTGRPFASLFNTNCQTTVYTALHLSLHNGWGRGEHSTDAKEEINEESHVAIPALYRGTTKMTPSPSNSPLQKWDALTAELIRSSIVPMCLETRGEIYLQIGVGGFNECGGKLLWSAVCCAASDGDGSFSFGLVKDGGVRLLSIKALEELIGVASVLSGDCGEMGQKEEELASLLKKQLNDIKTPNSDALSEEHTDIRNSQEAGTSDSENEEVIEHVNDEASSYTSSFSSDMDVEESTNETESSGSALLYIVSSTISLLYAPFSPIVNKVTNFPFQLTYVLQEDLAVLASVPGDSYTLVNNLCSGVCSGVTCTLSTLYQTGETSVCTVYACLSPLASSLGQAFLDGFTGTGTLASDALGIVTGTVGNGFSIIKMVFGPVCDQMVDYLCAVSSEMGHQVSTVGSGTGKLLWRSGRGVGHVLNIIASVMGGVVENTITNVQEAFGESSGESSESQMPELLTSEVVGE
ncbi:endonuclease domain-containing 1 protein isoform X2 [Pseudorasbora parva]|uniref:endonuclease domain-containing 1 protein isoform X2 n=1 Tax=Pseudorasbora parva TaxID=51549 RepID=UPI00351DACF7